MQTATATDEYPEKFEIEIDRKSLIKYYRRRWLLGWIAGFAVLAFIIGLIVTPKNIQIHTDTTVWDLIFTLVIWIGGGIGLSILISIALYFLLSHRYAKAKANNTRVFVEGPFLHVHQIENGCVVDQKLHFNSIVNYVVIESRSMKRHGIQTLGMITTTNCNAGILGIKDCYKIRDMLADIDRLREDS